MFFVEVLVDGLVQIHVLTPVLPIFTNKFKTINVLLPDVDIRAAEN